MAAAIINGRYLAIGVSVFVLACGGLVGSDDASKHDGPGGATNKGGSGVGGSNGANGGASASGGASGGATGGVVGKGGASGAVAIGGNAGVGGATECSAATCPNGCCTAGGECVDGTDDTACGASGNACLECSAAGFTSCDPGVKACIAKQTDCQPENCQQGCCMKIGGSSNGSYCYDGLSPSACGTGGQICSDCTQSTGVCDPVAHACGIGWCNAQNCSGGCCLGSQCVAGTDLLACGSGGEACGNCDQQGLTCQMQFGVPGGKCAPPLCDDSNCAGCCVGDVCAVGNQPNACGAAGVVCADCGLQGKACVAGQCQ